MIRKGVKITIEVVDEDRFTEATDDAINSIEEYGDYSIQYYTTERAKKYLEDEYKWFMAEELPEICEELAQSVASIAGNEKVYGEFLDGTRKDDLEGYAGYLKASAEDDEMMREMRNYE